VLRNILWHMLAGKNTGASAFGGFALQAIPQTSPMLGKRHFRQELSGEAPAGRKRFLRASAMLKHVIDIGWTSVSPSVCLSVTRWHCIKTAEHIVMLSSPQDSPFILVLCISRSSRNSDGVTPRGVAKYRWCIKFARCAIFY